MISDEAAYRAYAMLAVFECRVQQALACIRYAQQLCSQPYVAFSAGKDSSVMLDLILQVEPTVQVRILTAGETRIVRPGFDDCLNWWHKRYPRMQLEEMLIDHVFADGYQTLSYDEHYDTFESKDHRDPAGDWDGVYLGLRGEESSLRKAWLRHRMDGHAIRQYTSGKRAGIYRICPLADWRLADVAAYIITRGIPLPGGYEGGFGERTTTRLARRPVVQFGQLATLRARHPEAYFTIIRRWPELARWT